MLWIKGFRRKAVNKKSHKNLSKFSQLLNLSSLNHTDGNYSIIF